uniref:Uncharacterized protein n=2 Tax=Amphora coffeiformis TaxID=265554 RepID=A0A7S3P427_9STRA
MSSQALRRSRRAPAKKPEFAIGQFVELNRFNEKTVKVQLTQLLTEGSSTMHPRWLVLFPDNHLEECYEHRFGKIFRADGEEEGSESRRSSASNSPVPPGAASSAAGNNNMPDNKTAPTKVRVITTSPTPSNGKNSPSSETDPEGKKRSVSFHHHQQQQQHESDGGDSAGRKSAREERSRRRQAMIDEVPPLPATVGGAVASIPPPIKRKISNVSSKGGSKSKRQRQEAGADEPVTKVKFLTGTLYLYRGRHRRAEFVRRV